MYIKETYLKTREQRLILRASRLNFRYPAIEKEKRRKKWNSFRKPAAIKMSDVIRSVWRQYPILSRSNHYALSTRFTLSPRAYVIRRITSTHRAWHNNDSFPRCKNTGDFGFFFEMDYKWYDWPGKISKLRVEMVLK